MGILASLGGTYVIMVYLKIICRRQKSQKRLDDMSLNL